MRWTGKPEVLCRGGKAAFVAVALVLGWGCSTPGSDSDGQGTKTVEVYYTEGAVGGSATKGDWDSALAESHVECGVDDVNIEDLDSQLDEGVMEDGWNRPVSDEQNRCGDDFETLLFRVANCERKVRGLSPLECDLRMVWAGREHSRDMERRGYFDHVTPEGVTPDERLDERGVDWRATAENIAQAPTMALAHTAWMESEGHRSNVLSTDFTHMGVGVIEGQAGYMVTVLFLRPM